MVTTELQLGRGVSFHVPPTNVPLNCAYSLVAGLLAGNTCIVRLSTNIIHEIQNFLRVIASVLENDEHEQVSKRIALVQFGHDDVATQSLSEICDIRVIWGGDITISHLRSIPSKPRSIDISFADRISLTLIRTEALRRLSTIELREFSERFYSDSFTFSQNACSSPKVVIWHDEDPRSHSEPNRFWESLNKIILERNQVDSFQTITRFTELCEFLTEFDYVKNVEKLESASLRLQLENPAMWSKISRLRFGTFSEIHVHDILEVGQLIDDRLQTVSYFGYSAQELRALMLKLSPRGIDRLVPVGQALNFDLIWDGIDLIKMMTRTVVIT